MAYLPKACFGKTKVSIADLSVTFPQEYHLLRHRSKTPNKRKGRITMVMVLSVRLRKEYLDMVFDLSDPCQSRIQPRKGRIYSVKESTTQTNMLI